MNIEKLLNELGKEVNKVQNENATFNTIRNVLEAKAKLGLYKCKLRDCEVDIDEYGLASSVEDARCELGWPWGELDTKVEEILSPEQFAELLIDYKVRTLYED